MMNPQPSEPQAGKITSSRKNATFPFVALVGQDEMKRALVIAAMDPGLGGVLLFGERGTGKSTAVRSLRDVLPQIETIEGCAFGCEMGVGSCPVPDCSKRVIGRTVMVQRPMIDLPLGTTEDRLLGSIDLEAAIKSGDRVFEPGLLAKAHRGILYIDEVNLLEDSLVDVLLDVLASKENIVEREGISVKHPAQIVLVGSCNPEEGELRPQLLDRFGLAVFLQKEDSIVDRVEVVRRRLAFEEEPEELAARFAQQTNELKARIADGMARLASVIIPDNVVQRASRLCSALDLEGHRGELALVRSARALAAFEGRSIVLTEDIDSVALMCLRHRLRKGPFDPYAPEHKIAEAIAAL